MILTMPYVKEHCKLGRGADCCRYLMFSAKGFECAKADPTMKWRLDLRAELKEMTAQADNCIKR